MNNKRVFLNSGEIHYFRVRRELWDKHLEAAREAGLTTVSTYVPWAWHESEEGVFDFDGTSCPERDLEDWLRRCQANGLTCIVNQYREEVKMRNRKGEVVPSDGVSLFHPKFQEKVTRWYDQVMPLISKGEISVGGPIIMMQICNEIGVFSWLAHQGDYSENVRTRFISYLSVKALQN